LCITGQCEQTVSFVDAVALVEVLCIHGGRAITAFDFMSMSTFNPGWRTDTAGDATQYVKFANDPLKFFIYPKAPATLILIGEYAQTPPNYTGAQAVALLPDAFFPVVVDGTVFLAESVDNEHVNSNRAQLFQQAFTQALGVRAQARTLTDTEEAGLPNESVVAS
jgi:hypothetical protein